MQVNVTSYQIKDLINASSKPLIILGEGADADLSSLAVALVEVFESYSKKTVLVNKSPLPDPIKHFVKAEAVADKVESKKLVLTMDWAKNKLEKISYDLEGDKFNLIIAASGKKIDPKEITYSYRGQDFDLVVMLGLSGEEDLYQMGIDQDSFISLPSILIAKKQEAAFAKLNIVNGQVDSVCALLAKIFEEAKVTLPTRAAEAMLYGIRLATGNFVNVTDPQTFESAAFCKRSMIPGMVKNEPEEKKELKKEDSGEKAAEWLSPKVFRSGRVS